MPQPFELVRTLLAQGEVERISVKTVEANLSRIFHKSGVRSRTELTRG